MNVNGFFFLNKRKKFIMIMIVASQIVANLLDIFGLGIVAPYIFLITNPTFVEKNGILKGLYINFGNNDMNSFILLLGLFIIAFLVFGGIFKILSGQAVLRFSKSVNLLISQGYLDKILNLKYLKIQNEGIANLKFSIVNDLISSINYVLKPSIDLMSKIIVVLITFSTLILINPIVILSVAFFVILVYFIVSQSQKKRVIKLGKENRQRLKEVNRLVGNIIDAVKDIKLFNSNEAFKKEISSLQVKQAETEFRTNLLSNSPKIILETLSLVGILIFIIINRNSEYIEQTLPILGIVVLVFLRLNGIFQKIFQNITLIKSNLPIYKDFKNKFIEFSKIESQESKSDINIIFNNHIQLVNSYFSYGDKLILNNINIKINKGGRFAIVGPSGSGKSTLVDIISGLIKPTQGQIYIDGNLIENTELLWQSGLISYVSQQIVLIDRSIKENIAFGLSLDLINQSEVEKACEVAQIADFINELPLKYDTIIGDDGLKMSGGQKQRIALARALYRKSSVLILDEATSALDGITESNIIKAIQNLKVNTTIIIISHRISTIKFCEEIILLNNGSIHGFGTWAELMETNELFQQLSGDFLQNE